MPNWNHNIITLTAKNDEAKKQIHDFIDKNIVVSKEANWSDSLLEVEGNTLIPMPEGIKKLMGMSSFIQKEDGTIEENKDYSEEEERKQREYNRKEYGHEDWYSFCCDEWGSKWGFCHTAFHNPDDYDVVNTKEELHNLLELNGYIEFKTDCAWGPAVGLMKKICELYPDIDFLCEWGEEQVTEYYGTFTYNKEKGWEETYKEQMNVDEAYDMLDRLGLLCSEEDDGFFPNHNTNLVDYDERLNADSEEYLTEDQREGIIFGDNIISTPDDDKGLDYSKITVTKKE